MIDLLTHKANVVVVKRWLVRKPFVKPTFEEIRRQSSECQESLKRIQKDGTKRRVIRIQQVKEEHQNPLIFKKIVTTKQCLPPLYLFFQTQPPGFKACFIDLHKLLSRSVFDPNISWTSPFSFFQGLRFFYSLSSMRILYFSNFEVPENRNNNNNNWNTTFTLLLSSILHSYSDIHTPFQVNMKFQPC